MSKPAQSAASIAAAAAKARVVAYMPLIPEMMSKADATAASAAWLEMSPADKKAERVKLRGQMLPKEKAMDDHAFSVAEALQRKANAAQKVVDDAVVAKAGKSSTAVADSSKDAPASKDTKGGAKSSAAKATAAATAPAAVGKGGKDAKKADAAAAPAAVAGKKANK
jgi:hypothetical protein